MAYNISNLAHHICIASIDLTNFYMALHSSVIRFGSNSLLLLFSNPELLVSSICQYFHCFQSHQLTTQYWTCIHTFGMNNICWSIMFFESYQYLIQQLTTAVLIFIYESTALYLWWPRCCQTSFYLVVYPFGWGVAKGHAPNRVFDSQCLSCQWDANIYIYIYIYIYI